MDTTEKPFQIIFSQVNELRMGSPFNACKIKIIGEREIKLPNATWQDKYAWTGDLSKLVLVKWNFIENNPGFNLFLIDVKTGQSKESPRLFGLPITISIANQKVQIHKFVHDKEKSKHGELCCNIDEEFEFS